MFTTRLISGIVLVIIAAFLLVRRQYSPLFLAPWRSPLIGLYELYRVMKIERSAPGFYGLCGCRCLLLDHGAGSSM